MIILFSNCGFAIIAFLFYLCGSNRVAEVFADFIVNNCYLIFAVLLIITFLISFYLVRKNSFKSVKVTATIGFTILDFAKVLIFYLLLVTWSIDFVCHNDVLNSIISLLVIPLDLILMCHKVTHKKLIDNSPLFRKNFKVEFHGSHTNCVASFA